MTLSELLAQAVLAQPPAKPRPTQKASPLFDPQDYADAASLGTYRGMKAGYEEKTKRAITGESAPERTRVAAPDFKAVSDLEAGSDTLNLVKLVRGDLQRNPRYAGAFTAGLGGLENDLSRNALVQSMNLPWPTPGQGNYYDKVYELQKKLAANDPTMKGNPSEMEMTRMLEHMPTPEKSYGDQMEFLRTVEDLKRRSLANRVNVLLSSGVDPETIRGALGDLADQFMPGQPVSRQPQGRLPGFKRPGGQ